jgi:hypothetical protein
MLVHMTPEEVASLQALAMKNGGSLTINPDTGLPEAGFLKKLLPMIAGFALGPAGFGLMSAAGAGLAVGGVTALATGSLSKGLMAGLGAYGGAGIGEAFMGAGAKVGAGTGANLATSLTDAQAQALGFQNAATAPAANAAATSNLDKIGAGFKAVTDSPSALGQFAKDNWKAGLAAASPFIADAMVPTTTKMPAATPGYIRPFQYDANTRTVKAMDPVLASEWGARQFPDFIRKEQAPPPAGLGQQLPPGMATGGIVALAEGGETDPYARYNTLSGQSKAAYDYLMGNTASAAPAGIQAIAPRPVVSNTNAPATTTTPSTSMTTTPVTGGGGGGGVGGGAGPIMGGASVGNAVSDTDPSPTYSGFVPAPANPNIPVEDRVPTPTIQDDGTTPGIQEIIDRMPEAPVDDGTTAGIQEIIDRMPETPVDDGTTAGIQEIIDRLPEAPEAPVDDGTTAGIQEIIDRMPETPVEPYYSDTTEEVQDWQNVDNSGYYDGSMAGDNSLNSGNNTYTGETDSVQQQGLPDAFGSYLGEPTYIGNDDGGGYDGFVGDDNNIDEDRYDYAGNANGGLMGYANGGMMPRYALGGLGALGGYSDGGRLLKGPGDGVSDSIPATIGRKKHPARLADGEFVVPARIVSELGNGSTEAGARKLYAMMDRIQKARGKTVGKGKVAANSRSEKHLPA